MDESLTSLLHKYMPNKHANQMQGRRQGGGLRGLHPPTQKKREEKRERGEEERKKEERGIKRERKLNQSFQEHVTYVVMGL